MQTRKRGNPHHVSKRRRTSAPHPIEQQEQQSLAVERQEQQPLAVARVTLHHSDPITGNADRLSSLFYECYRGYTIYSTETGVCCIHGAGYGGCLRLQGKYVVFPDVEDAKTLMKWFVAENRTAHEEMNRFVAREAYVCLNWPRREREQASA